jgi:hypothetical protein
LNTAGQERQVDFTATNAERGHSSCCMIVNRPAKSRSFGANIDLLIRSDAKKMSRKKEAIHREIAKLKKLPQSLLWRTRSWCRPINFWSSESANVYKAKLAFFDKLTFMSVQLRRLVAEAVNRMKRMKISDTQRRKPPVHCLFAFTRCCDI